VAEDEVVYLAPTGTDEGTCTRTSPCFRLQFAVSQTGAARHHIVMTSGTYNYNGGSATVLGVSPGQTSAVRIDIHGGGSTVSFTQADGQAMFNLSLPTSMTDMTLDYRPFGRAVVARAPTTLKRMLITSETGVEVRSTVTAEELAVFATVGNGTPTSIRVESGSLDLKRSTLFGGSHGITANSGSIVELENVLVSDTTLAGIDLIQGSATSASLSFVTIARTGTGATAGAAGLICPNPNTPVRSTIVWTPNGMARPAISGCALSSTIAGPIGVVGATNMDPQFVDLNSGDYHLSDVSPAKDLVDVGPAVDFEGDPRPSGARFDIGADEAR
jgi:hypothetical protein